MERRYPELDFHSAERLVDDFVGRYKEYRKERQSPKTSTEIYQMARQCLAPVLDWYEQWENQQKMDSALVNDIIDLIEERRKNPPDAK